MAGIAERDQVELEVFPDRLRKVFVVTLQISQGTALLTPPAVAL